MGIDWAPSDTSDVPLRESTLGEAKHGRLFGRVHKLRLWRGPNAKSAAVPATARVNRARHHGLRPWQWMLIVFGALVLVIAILTSVDASLYYTKVHYGIRVNGQDLGGMTPERATETLSTLAEEAQKRAISIKSTSGSRTWSVLPSGLGTSIDVPGAVSKAMALTREGNFFVDLANKISLYFSDEDIPLEGTIDSDKMDTLLAGIAKTLDAPPADATLVVNNGSVEVVEGKQGKVVDTEALRASLIQLLLTLQSAELAIPLVTTEPALKQADIEPALAQVSVMIGSDLVLTSKGETVATLTPEEIFTYLDIESDGGGESTKAVPVLSAEKMKTLLDSLDKELGTPGLDAHFEVDVETDTFKLIDGVDGVGVDREAAAAALTQAALRTSDRTAEVVMKAVPPDLTTEEVRAMGIKDILGEYATTPYSGPGGRQANVRLATRLCSGVFLAPGEEFNTDQRLGVRSKATGWRVAPGISASGAVEGVYGGGICQVSTTLFNAVLLSGLEITERHNHSFYIYHYPDGRDATVSGGGKNFRFRNDTDHYVYIYGTSTGIRTRFYILGVADGRKVLPIVFSGFTIGPPFPVQTRINTSLPPGTTVELCSGARSKTCSIERTVVYADGTRKTQSWSSYYSTIPQVFETNPL